MQIFRTAEAMQLCAEVDVKLAESGDRFEAGFDRCEQVIEAANFPDCRGLFRKHAESLVQSNPLAPALMRVILVPVVFREHRFF